MLGPAVIRREERDGPNRAQDCRRPRPRRNCARAGCCCSMSCGTGPGGSFACAGGFHPCSGRAWSSPGFSSSAGMAGPCSLSRADIAYNVLFHLWPAGSNANRRCRRKTAPQLHRWQVAFDFAHLPLCTIHRGWIQPLVFFFIFHHHLRLDPPETPHPGRSRARPGMGLLTAAESLGSRGIIR